MARIPYSISLRSYDQVWEYGIGMTWVAFLSLRSRSACLPLPIHVGDRPLVGRRLDDIERNAISDSVAITLAVIVRFSPALWGSRYQIAPWARAGDDCVASQSPSIPRHWRGSFRSAFRDEHRVILLDDAAHLAVVVRSSRICQNPLSPARIYAASAIEPTLNRWNGSPVVTETGMAREKELGRARRWPSPQIMAAIWPLLEQHVFQSSRVHSAGPDFMDRLRTSDATWAYCATGDPTCSGFLARIRDGSSWVLGHRRPWECLPTRAQIVGCCRPRWDLKRATIEFAESTWDAGIETVTLETCVRL